MQTSQSTITPVVTEANVECFSRCLTATMAYNESHTATSTGLITEKLDHVSSPPSQHRQQHPHLIQTDGADKKAMILPSNLEVRTPTESFISRYRIFCDHRVNVLSVKIKAYLFPSLFIIKKELMPYHIYDVYFL